MGEKRKNKRGMTKRAGGGGTEEKQTSGVNKMVSREAKKD